MVTPDSMLAKAMAGNNMADCSVYNLIKERA